MIHFSVLGLSTVGAVCVLLGAFVFAAVAARLVGLVGGSWSPVAPLAVAVVIATVLLFARGRNADPAQAKLTAMLVGTLVTIAICQAGDLSQDLKTGFLLRATPCKQQIGQMLGVLVSAVAIAAVILMLNRTRGFVQTDATPDPLPAFEAKLIKRVLDDAFAGQLPWELILIGAMAALVMELLGVPSLAFGVGLYLPLSISTPVMVGGLIRAAVDRWRKPVTDAETRGVLSASGLVGGYALTSVVLAAVGGLVAWAWHDPTYRTPFDEVPRPVMAGHFQPWLADKLGFDATYGLGDRADTASAAVSMVRPEDEHHVRYTNLFWFNLLPLVPFALLSIWLLVAAARRGPPDRMPAAEVPPGPQEPHEPIEVGDKGFSPDAPPEETYEWRSPSDRLDEPPPEPAPPEPEPPAPPEPEPPAPPEPQDRPWSNEPVSAPIPLSEPEPAEPSESAAPEPNEPEAPVEPPSEPAEMSESEPAVEPEVLPADEPPPSPQPAPADEPKPAWRSSYSTVRSTDDLPPMDTMLRRDEPSPPSAQPEETVELPFVRTDEPTVDHEPDEQTDDAGEEEPPR